MPDNPFGWDIFRRVGNFLLPGDPFGQPGGGGGGAADWLSGQVRDWARGRPPGSPILPRDPDGSIDWETITGQQDTDWPRQQQGVTNQHGCQIYVPLQQDTRLRAPKGYVVVTRTNADGSKQKVGMLREAAQKCGLWKRAPRPPITASEYKTVRTANRVIKKVDRVVKMTNEIQGKARLTRSRSSKRC